jgi:hypothetical protein
MKRVLMLVTLLVSTASLAAPIQAQIFTPSYMSPIHLNDLGVYLSDAPGDLAIEGIWRGGPLGLRVGVLDGNGDNLISVGGEIRSPIPVPGAPLGLALTFGAQALVGDGNAYGGQVGVTAGHRFLIPGLAITPYIHPRLAAIDSFGTGRTSEVLADVGVDVEIPENLIFRFGLGLSRETSDWGFGIALRR